MHGEHADPGGVTRGTHGSCAALVRFVPPPSWLDHPAAFEGLSPALRGAPSDGAERNLFFRYGDPCSGARSAGAKRLRRRAERHGCPPRARAKIFVLTLGQLAPELLPGAVVAFDDLVFDVEFEFECERYRMLVRSVAWFEGGDLDSRPRPGAPGEVVSSPRGRDGCGAAVQRSYARPRGRTRTTVMVSCWSSRSNRTRQSPTRSRYSCES